MWSGFDIDISIELHGIAISITSVPLTRHSWNDLVNLQMDCDRCICEQRPKTDEEICWLNWIRGIFKLTVRLQLQALLRRAAKSSSRKRNKTLHWQV